MKKRKKTKSSPEAVIDHIEFITTRLEIEEVKLSMVTTITRKCISRRFSRNRFRKLWSDDAKEVELTPLGLKTYQKNNIKDRWYCN